MNIYGSLPNVRKRTVPITNKISSAVPISVVIMVLLFTAVKSRLRSFPMGQSSLRTISSNGRCNREKMFNQTSHVEKSLFCNGSLKSMFSLMMRFCSVWFNMAIAHFLLKGKRIYR